MRKWMVVTAVVAVAGVADAGEQAVRLGVKVCYVPTLQSPAQRQAEYRADAKREYRDVEPAKLEELAGHYSMTFTTKDPVRLATGWACTKPYTSGRLVVLPPKGDEALAKWDLVPVPHQYGNALGGQFENTSFSLLVPKAEFAALLAANKDGVRLKLLAGGDDRTWGLKKEQVAELLAE